MPIIELTESDRPALETFFGTGEADAVELRLPQSNRFSLSRGLARDLAEALDREGAATICSVRGKSAIALPPMRSPAAPGRYDIGGELTDRPILIICPVIFQGGCFEHELANFLASIGKKVVVAVTQDIDPRRFVAIDRRVKLLSIGQRRFGDVDLASFATALETFDFPAIIVGRAWLIADDSLYDLLGGRGATIVACDRGMGPYRPEWDEKGVYSKIDIISLILEDHRFNFPEQLHVKIQTHGLFPKLSRSRLGDLAISPRDNEKKQICYFGRLDDEKNSQDIVPIFSALIERAVHDYVFHIIGSGPAEDRLREAVLASGIQ
ncbi:MAG: hypothetical protein HKN78_04730, partial [Sphingomonadaceae bacterium]|nr:hypothetical protein [Sphingomonadaceae bacterium]